MNRRNRTPPLVISEAGGKPAAHSFVTVAGDSRGARAALAASAIGGQFLLRAASGRRSELDIPVRGGAK